MGVRASAADAVGYWTAWCESLPDGDEYLDAVVKETLRMRPVVTDVGRQLTRDIELAGYRIPAGALVMPAITAIHFRADLYPDPDEFRPERFLSAPRSPTRGSRSAAACGAASGPRSRSSRCG